MHLRRLLPAPSKMSGVEVAAIVASILAAFGSGMDMFKRMRAKQKARKQGRQGGKLTQEELRLQQSLSCGPQQIRAEYNKNVIKLGHRFKVGDTTAQNSLAHTLLVLNTGLVKIVHHALSEDSKAREMSKRSLLGLSELAAADTLNTLGQLNKRLTCGPGFALQTQPQPRKPHKRNKKSVQEKDQTLSASRTSSAQPKAKKRPGPDPLARGAWVRSRSGASAVSSGSSTPRPSRQASNHSSFSLTIDQSLGQAETTGLDTHLAQSCLPCTCGARIPAPRYEPGVNIHHSHGHAPQQIQQPELLIVSPEVFNTDYVPPRPPKVPIERPAFGRRPRPPSVATFLTASTKIGEIPEHKWLDQPALSGCNRPLPYVIPPPLEPEPTKKKARGFKSWWKSHGKVGSHAETEVLVA